MRKTAGFLKFFVTFAIVVGILGVLLLLVAEGYLLAAGNLSAMSGAITISGTGITPETIDAMKPFLLIAIGLTLVALIFSIMGGFKTRKALAECQEERPFSQLCIDNIKASARLDIISGIIGIVSTVILTVAASSITLNGTSVKDTTATVHLGFILNAVQKYLLYHIACYGQSLENKQ